ncbi:DUF2793 domain-containing protein [Rhodoplanes sp.]|uniref:DUF2793 domain-containing protein n=1 Tax=Rhodoplanes sp. TaxID=1968906 RepID=UPI0025ED8B7D|nr:DUF2793 domain-containing protein [Rhodoplanes sp.]
MTDTPNLALPCIDAAQAQKHVTHNEALRLLDTLVQLTVHDRHLAAPPASPAEGDRHIVATGATDAWAGHSGQIAAWQDGAWLFAAPRVGWLAYVVDEGALVAWTGAAWIDAIAALTALDNMTRLGVGTTADATNPFAAKLNNALWVARTVAEGGDGNLRCKMSKESAARTLSLLFQDAYSGRAEIGLTGDDDLHVKVSPDGTTWKDALVVDRATGALRIGSALGLAARLAPPTLTASQNDYAPAGLDATAVVCLAADAARAVTGLAGGTAGAVKVLLNTGATTITLTDSSAASAAGNRFLFGRDAVLAPGRAAVLLYDATLAGWTLIAGTSGPGTSITPGGRLTLASATPVPTANVTAASTIYYTPYVSNAVPVADGAGTMIAMPFGELANVTTASSVGKAGPAAVVANANYDLFVWNDGGVLRLTRGPAWTSDTARGTGTGTSELQTTAGLWTNKFAIGNGPAPGMGTYVGTMRSDGSGLIEDSGQNSNAVVKRFVWNKYNRVARKVAVHCTTASWTYGSITLREINGTSSNEILMVRGDDEDPVSVRHIATAVVTTGAAAIWGLGLDGATSYTGVSTYVGGTSGQTTASAEYDDCPGLGFHRLIAVESVNGSGTATFFGSLIGKNQGLIGTVMA